MDSYVDYDSIKRGLENDLDEERRRYSRFRQNLNAAAISDFASNLLSLAGYNRGARVSLATNNVAVSKGQYDVARERYQAALKDYEARIADVNLRQRMKQNAPLKPVGFVSTANVGIAPAASSRLRLSKGVLEGAIKKSGINN